MYPFELMDVEQQCKKWTKLTLWAPGCIAYYDIHHKDDWRRTQRPTLVKLQVVIEPFCHRDMRAVVIGVNQYNKALFVHYSQHLDVLKLTDRRTFGVFKLYKLPGIIYFACLMTDNDKDIECRKIEDWKSIVGPYDIYEMVRWWKECVSMLLEFFVKDIVSFIHPLLIEMKRPDPYE